MHRPVNVMTGSSQLPHEIATGKAASAGDEDPCHGFALPPMTP